MTGRRTQGPLISGLSPDWPRRPLLGTALMCRSRRLHVVVQSSMSRAPLLTLLFTLCSVQRGCGFSQAVDSDFTFTLPAGNRECFYQTMRKDGTLEIEYQVLDGSSLDVDFYLFSPNGDLVLSEQRQSDGVHTVETVDGDYQFCFDNTFSRMSDKVIFFELILDHVTDGEEQEDWKNYVIGTDLLDMKLEDIMETINSVKARLGKSLQIQTLLKAFEARDRNIQESNCERVNFWSTVNLVVMVAVCVTQVYMLKSLFEDKRKSRP